MKRSISLPAIGFTIGCVLIAVSFSAEPAPEPSAPQPSASRESRERQAERLILDRLDSAADWELEQTPLAELVDRLRERLGVNVHLDWRELELLGISPDLTVSGKFAQTSHRAVLDALLDPLDLDWMIHNESLIITSPQRAETQLACRIFNVADLAANQAELENLIQVITRIVHPESWDELGGPGSIAFYETPGLRVLIVSQTQHVHHRIARLLAELRQELGTAEIEPHPAKVKLDALRGSPLLRGGDRKNEEANRSETTPESSDGESSAPANRSGAWHPPVQTPLGPMSGAILCGNDVAFLNRSNERPPSARRDAVLRANQFSIDLFREMKADSPQNIVVAGYAVREALALASFKARGREREELLEVLRLPKDRRQAARELILLRGYLQAHSANTNENGSQWNMKTGLWFDEEQPADEEFTNFSEFAKLLHGAHVEGIPIKNEESYQEKIGRWGRDTNRGMTMGSGYWPRHERPFTQFGLAAATEFRGNWLYPFAPEHTERAPFTTLKGNTVRVPTMTTHVKKHWSFANYRGVDALELPYRDNNLSLVMVWPSNPETRDLAALEGGLSAEWLEEITSQLGIDAPKYGTGIPYSGPAMIYLPKFYVYTSSPLLRPLAKMGLNAVLRHDEELPFAEDDGFGLYRLRHRASLSVDEAESEYDDMAGMEIFDTYGGYAPPSMLTIHINRPFLFFVHDRNTGAILLLGRITNPLPNLEEPAP